jgi:hypothetical protein
MEVSDQEIAERLSKWKAPKMKVNRGALAKYVYLVGDASHGVCIRPLPPALMGPVRQVIALPTSEVVVLGLTSLCCQ